MDRVGISQIKKSLKLNKGFGKHPRTHRKPLKSFREIRKEGRIRMGEMKDRQVDQKTGPEVTAA